MPLTPLTQLRALTPPIQRSRSQATKNRREEAGIVKHKSKNDHVVIEIGAEAEVDPRDVVVPWDLTIGAGADLVVTIEIEIKVEAGLLGQTVPRRGNNDVEIAILARPAAAQVTRLQAVSSTRKEERLDNRRSERNLRGQHEEEQLHEERECVWGNRPLAP